MPAPTDKKTEPQPGRDTHVRPPRVVPAQGDAYAPLQPFGAGYDSTMAQIHRAGLAAQRANCLDAEARRCWRDLRDVGKRIMGDAAWMPLVEGDTPVPLPPPPEVEPPGVPPPQPADLLAEVEAVPVPPVPPYAPGPRPTVPLDLWTLAEELLDDPGDSPEFADDVPSFLEGMQ